VQPAHEKFDKIMNYVNFTAVCGFSVSKLILYWSNTVLTRWHHLNIQVPFITFALIFSKYCIMKVFKLHIGPSNSTFEIFFFFFYKYFVLLEKICFTQYITGLDVIGLIMIF